jgi:hypothetical protein
VKWTNKSTHLGQGNLIVLAKNRLLPDKVFVERYNRDAGNCLTTQGLSARLAVLVDNLAPCDGEAHAMKKSAQHLYRSKGSNLFHG